MADYKLTNGDYFIICDNGVGNLNIQANVDIQGTLTYSNVVTVNAAFFTVAESNPGTILDMGLLAQTGPNAFAGLRFDVPSNTWQISNSVNGSGNAISPYIPILTTSSNLSNPNIGNATATSINVSSTIQTSNLVASNNIIVSGWANVGNLSSLNVVQGNTGNFDVIYANSITSTGDVVSGGTLSATGQVSGSDVIAAGVVSGLMMSASGNVTSDGIVTGNATANFFIGDGRYLTNIDAGNLIGGYGNGNVANFLPTFTGLVAANTVSATANITGDYFFGNGAFLSGLPESYSNANVAAFLPTYTGDITANSVSTSGNISGDYFLGNVASATGFPTLDNYSNANVANFLPIYSGDVTADYVSANYYIGDGNGISNIQWISISGANANVEAYLPTSTTILAIDSNVSSLANSTANNFSNVNGNVTTLSANVANVWVEIGNINGNASNTNSNVSTLSANVSNVWIEIGNINANVANTDSNVSTLSNTVANLSAGAYSNANVASYLPIYDGNILVDYVNANSVVLANATQTTRLSAPVTALVATNITLPTTVYAVNYDWVLKSTDNSAVSMGKGFVTANTTAASTTYYGNSTVGSGLGSVSVSGNSTALTFTASAGAVAGTFIIMLTEYL